MPSPRTRAAIYTILTILGVVSFFLVEWLVTKGVLTSIALLLFVIVVICILVYRWYKDLLEEKDRFQ